MFFLSDLTNRRAIITITYFLYKDTFRASDILDDHFDTGISLLGDLNFPELM